MGAVADAALHHGGTVHGVIPSSLVERELAHPRLTRLWTVGSMHERKAKMHALSGAFLALPGGCGTLDETFEAITWMQLRLHDKPIGFLDVDGYWEPIIRWLDRAVTEGFVRAEDAARVRVETQIEPMLEALAAPSTVAG